MYNKHVRMPCGGGGGGGMHGGLYECGVLL